MTEDFLNFVSQQGDKLHDAQIENIELKREIKRLRDALAPFTESGKYIFAKDFERARKVLNDNEPLKK